MAIQTLITTGSARHRLEDQPARSACFYLPALRGPLLEPRGASASSSRLRDRLRPLPASADASASGRLSCSSVPLDPALRNSLGASGSSSRAPVRMVSNAACRPKSRASAISAGWALEVFARPWEIRRFDMATTVPETRPSKLLVHYRFRSSRSQSRRHKRSPDKGANRG